jgi:hypothetical protein
MKYLSKLITDQECETFKQFWRREEAKRAYVNWEQDGKVLDRRLQVLHTDPEWEIVMRIVKQHFTDIKQVWAAYQMQNFAHNIHIDDYAKEQPLPTYTFVVSVLTEPKFRTVIWKETGAHNQILQQAIVDFWLAIDSNPTRITNISETEDLDHTPGRLGVKYVDYLHLDGIFSYVKGDSVLFNARQYHCTSDWTKHPEFTSREFLQIHVVSTDPIDLNQ